MQPLPSAPWPARCCAVLLFISVAAQLCPVSNAQPVPVTPLRPAVDGTSLPDSFVNVTNTNYYDPGPQKQIWQIPTMPNNMFPYYTNLWWTPWVHNNTISGQVGDQQVGMNPWRARLLTNAITVWPALPLIITPNNWSVVPNYDRYINITADEGLVARRIIGATNMGATFRWLAPRGDPGVRGSMRSTFLQGLPYITFVVNILTVRFTFADLPILQINDVQFAQGMAYPVQVTGNEFKVSLNGTMIYKFYTSTNVTLAVGQEGANTLPNTFAFSEPFQGVVRFALIENKFIPMMDYTGQPAVARAVENLYDRNSDIYPTRCTVAYGYQPANVSGTGAERGIVRFKFDTDSMSGNMNTSTGALMMLSMPHHKAKLIQGRFPKVASLTVRDLRGVLTPVLGDLWTLAYDLPDVSFNPKTNIADPDKLDAVITALLADAQLAASQAPNLPYGDTTYLGSSNLAALGRMSVIADQLAALQPPPAQAAQLLAASAQLRGLLQTYLDVRIKSVATTPASLAYDTTWGGLIPYGDVLGNKETNFGARFYNDHHFHYGYILQAAACLGKGNATWLAANRDNLIAILRDYANPLRNDTFFPFARMMNWWGSHSYAGGIKVLGDGKDQESTSEAVNGYYAVMLLGEVLGDPDLRRWGQLLAAVEVTGAQTYWQVSGDSQVYDAPFTDRRVVGVLWSTKVDSFTYFGDNLAFVHGIQMLPVTPISEVLLPTAWLQQALPLATSQYDTMPPYSDGFRQYLAMSSSILDPAAAWTTATSTLANSFFSGPWAALPQSVMLHYIASRPAPAN